MFPAQKRSRASSFARVSPAGVLAHITWELPKTAYESRSELSTRFSPLPTACCARRQAYIHVNFQGFKHCSIFHFQGSWCCQFLTAHLLYYFLSALSTTFLFFSNFLKLLSYQQSACSCGVVYNSKSVSKSQQLFTFFSKIL